MSQLQLVLEITAHAQASNGIKDIKTDPVAPAFGVVLAVHPKSPLVMFLFAFAEPVHVTRSFRVDKRESFGSNPGGYRQPGAWCDAELGAAGHLDVGSAAVKM
jgi:hypothetical protein